MPKDAIDYAVETIKNEQRRTAQLRLEVDKWRTMFAATCGAANYWAHVTLTTSLSHEEFSKQLKEDALAVWQDQVNAVPKEDS